MPKRKTVKINIDKVLYRCKVVGWSAATFSKKIGKHERWLSEVKRGRNLPSPEEAAQMCVILQVRPEKILTEPEDIELVERLLEGQKEKPPAHGEGQIHTIEDWDRALTGLSQDELREIMDIVMRKFLEVGK